MNINYVKKNFVFGLILQLTSILVSLFIRKYLVDCLGLYLLGVDGVFSNIMSLLKLLDFGIAASSVHFLYKALSSNDKAYIENTYLAYKKLFKRTALIISIIGILLIINVEWIVNVNEENINTIRAILFVHVLQVVVYYLIVCPRTAVECDQKRFVTMKIDFVVMLVFAILKFICLKYLQSYIGYLALMLFESITAGMLIKLYFDKNYLINYKKPIDSNSINNIQNYGKTMIITNINGFVYGATDNIILSKMVGEATVGLMSNYYMIVNTINMFSVNVTNSFTATIIHEINKDERDNNYLLTLSTVACYIIASFVCVCLLGLTTPFIGLYYGSKYIMDLSIPLLMIANVLVSIFQTPLTTTIIAMGLGKGEAKFSFFMMMINLILSIYLCYKIGAPGVLIGTVVANSFMLFGRLSVVYRKGFRISNKTLEKMALLFILSILQLCIIQSISIQVSSILMFIVKGVICLALWLIFILPILKWKETRVIIDSIKKMIVSKKETTNE